MNIGNLPNHVKYCVSVCLPFRWAKISTSPVPDSAPSRRWAAGLRGAVIWPFGSVLSNILRKKFEMVSKCFFVFSLHDSLWVGFERICLKKASNNSMFSPPNLNLVNSLRTSKGSWFSSKNKSLATKTTSWLDIFSFSGCFKRQKRNWRMKQPSQNIIWANSSFLSWLDASSI